MKRFLITSAALLTAALTSGAALAQDTVKIGVLGSPATISTVSSALASGGFTNVVLDPVLICKGQEPGHALDTDQALKAQIPTQRFALPEEIAAAAVFLASDAAKMINGVDLLVDGGYTIR